MKTPIPKRYQDEERLAGPLKISARKFGHKKRNPITASASGWKAPIKGTATVRGGKYDGGGKKT